ncbi:conserved hypothetical protein [Pseudomonas veronii]|uniref:hypothetical protein n=1 Tax=Pseudomonas veronii TaxID=76761 RepID=UPI00176F5A93|nr:hypothetical protein [Pseudomonas veronii]CAD0266068.1 conserved hypothetical protein [Pseudomonas veronii]
MTEHVVDFEGKPFVITFFKGIPPSASEVYLFLLDDCSVHQGVIDYRSTVFPQGAVSTTNPIGGFHEKLEIPLRRVAGYASAGPQYVTRERSTWLEADHLSKD